MAKNFPLSLSCSRPFHRRYSVPARVLPVQDTEGQWDKWLVADVVCHEVAHQWFGNLVTCATWQDITVNEARHVPDTYPALKPSVVPEAMCCGCCRLMSR